MTGLGQDVRGALRLFPRQPVLALSVAVTLGFGIAVSVVLFTLLYAFAFRPAAVRDPRSLVAVYTSDFEGPALGATSFPDYLAFERDARSVVSLAAASRISTALVLGDDVAPITGTAVSGTFFPLLGVAPHRGRLLQPGDDRPDAPPAVVVAHPLWRRRFGSDSGLVGATITLGEQRFTVVGIAPPDFGGLSLDAPSDFWISAAHRALITGEARILDDHGARVFRVVGRLARGASVERARAALNLAAGRLQAAYPEAWTDQRGQRRAVTVLPWQESLLAGNPGVRSAMVGGLAAVVGLVLLVVSSNVASLLLAHAATRRREVAIRAALGASRGRLARQRILETLALALAGGVVGLLAAMAGLDLLAARWPDGAPRVALTPDGPVFLFALILVLLATALAGAAPAIQSTRVPLARGLGEPAPVRRRGAGGVRGILIAGQLGVSSALLALTGVLLQSTRNAARIDPGFSASNVTAAWVELPRVYDSVAAAGFFAGVVGVLEGDPAVTAVAAAWTAPQDGSRVTATLEPDRGASLTTEVVGITPRYFELLAIPLVAGRNLSPAEAAGGSAAVVSQTLARRVWPDGALGRTFRLDRGGPVQIVGVARDAALFWLAEPAAPRVFVPFPLASRSHATVLVKATGSAAAVRDAVRRAVREVGPRAAIAAVEPLPRIMARQTAPQRALAGAGVVAGGLELLLAAIALAGLVAYGTAQRTREIGLRLALGATRRDVLRSLMRDGFRLAAAGVVVGLMAAWAALQVTRAALVDVGPFEPGGFALVTCLLVAVAALATYLPARRAARLDAMEALRHE